MSLRVACASALVLIGACNPSPKINHDAPTTSTSDVTAPARSSAGSDALSATAPPADAGARETKVRVVIASQDTDALSLVRTERLKAKGEGRVLVVYAG